MKVGRKHSAFMRPVMLLQHNHNSCNCCIFVRSSVLYCYFLLITVKVKQPANHDRSEENWLWLIRKFE